MGKKKRFKVKSRGISNRRDKIKILAYCDSPTCATGFGTVARNILMGWYNTGKYDIDILGINYWGEPHQYPFRIWPTGINNEKDPYGRQKVLGMIPKMDFDVLFVMQDSFILDFLPKLIQMLKAEGKDFVSICYFPVDAIIKPEWLNNVMVVDVPITYTKFAFNECIKVNPSIKDKLQIIPHGVDLNTFFPVKKERVNKFREAFFSFQADKFIYMNLNRNQQRKDIPRTIMAFKEVRKADPDTILYLHCAVKDVGHELDKVVQSFGFTLSDVVFPQNFGPNQGFPIETVNMIYNAVDVVVSTTLGEGFGFCLGPDVNVYTDSGIKTMKELTVEDKVLSSDGSYNEIEAVMVRKYEGDIFKINTCLNSNIISSPEHGFLTFTNNRLEWKKACNLTIIDRLVFPVCALKKIASDMLVFSKSFDIIDGFVVIPIKDITVSTYVGKLFDIQVAKTNDFVAENVVVHNSWIEAMATKTPVIMPANTAMAEYITDDIGYLVRSGSNPSLFTVLPYDNEMIRPLVDVEHLAETMLHVKNNYDEALEKAENAYKFVRENLTWQNHIIPMWIDILEKALTSDFNRKDIDKKSDKLILAENF